MTDISSSSESTEKNGAQRTGDPLDGLWHWSYHPVIRTAILISVLAGLLILFPLLAQITF